MGRIGYFFDNGGVRIHYTVEGEGPPLVLLHGLGSTGHAAWRIPGLADAFAPHFTVVLPDLRGHGRSEAFTDEELYGADMAADVIALMDHLGLERVQLAGYSMGGLLAQHLLVAYPERFTSVAICGIGFESGESGLFEDFEALADEVAAGNNYALMERIGVVEPDGAFDPVDRVVVNAASALLNWPSVSAAVIRGFDELTATSAQLKMNQTPVLVATGTEDPFYASARELAAMLPESGFVPIEGGDHASTPNMPLFREVLLRFFLATQPGP